VNLEEGYEFLNFFVNKVTGSYYSPPELDLIVDRGQMSLFEELRPKYATSQRIQDALAPFLEDYEFTASNTLSGYIIVPSDRNYITLLDIQINFGISNRTVYASVPIVNKDERSNRLNSQLNPVTVTSPIAEQTAPRYFKIYPISGYEGTVTYFRRPVAPYFDYTLISGRVIQYNSAQSVQLEWPEDWQNAVYIKALSSIGINIRESDIEQFAEQKGQNNFLNQNNF